MKDDAERYVNYLDPNINRSPFTPEEDALLLARYNEFGPKWLKISTFFSKRTGMTLKNRYNFLKKNGKTIVQAPPVIPDIFDINSDLDFDFD